MSSKVVFGITRRGDVGMTLLPKYFDFLTSMLWKTFLSLLFCHWALSGGGIDATIDDIVVSDAKLTVGPIDIVM